MASSFVIGSEHAAFYRHFRPVTPANVVTKIITYLKEKIDVPLKYAVDAGCGSGQSTEILAPYFENVTGIDLSESQIAEARQSNTLPNVEYKAGPVEKIPFDSGSLQLVTACQSAHWFNLPDFYQEMDRVLAPFGVLALYCYSLPLPVHSNETIMKNAQEVVKQFYHADMGSYFSHQTSMIDNCYKDIILPYEDNIRDSVISHVNSTLSNYFGYFRSWSTYHKIKENDPVKAESLMNRLYERLSEALEAPSVEMPITLQTEYFIVMGRKGGKTTE